MSRFRNKYYDALKESGALDEEEIPEENLLPRERAQDRSMVQKTVFLVLLFIGILSVLEAVVLLIFVKSENTAFAYGKWGSMIGLAVGSLTGVGWFFTMKYQIDSILSGGSSSPKATLKIGAIIRIFVVVGIIVAAYFTKLFNPVTVIIGIFNLKIASFAVGFLQRKTAFAEIKKAPEADPEPKDVDEFLDDL